MNSSKSPTKSLTTILFNTFQYFSILVSTALDDVIKPHGSVTGSVSGFSGGCLIYVLVELTRDG